MIPALLTPGFPFTDYPASAYFPQDGLEGTVLTKTILTTELPSKQSFLSPRSATLWLLCCMGKGPHGVYTTRTVGVVDGHHTSLSRLC